MHHFINFLFPVSMNTAATNNKNLNITVQSDLDLYRRVKEITINKNLLKKLDSEETIYCLAAVECYDINSINEFYRYYNCIKDKVEHLIINFPIYPQNKDKDQVSIHNEIITKHNNSDSEEDSYNFKTLETAKEFFDTLDSDGDGLLTSRDIAKLLYINKKYPLAFHFNIYSNLSKMLLKDKRIEFHSFMTLLVKY